MKRFGVLAGAGLAGVLSLGLVPLERLAPVAMDPAMLRALALVQPAILTLIAVAVGCRAAPKVGLGSPLVDAFPARRNVRAVLRAQLPAALAAGAATALLLILYGATVGRMIADGADSPLAGLTMPLATKLLYGGITEELLTRWGLVSLFAWIAWATGGRPPVPGRPTMWVAIVLAAGLFAAGHLPMLSLVMPGAPAGIVAAVLAANMLPGILFGWLFWRRGIEAAMIAHALAHLLSHPFAG